jgi:hypothetical protein
MPPDFGYAFESLPTPPPPLSETRTVPHIDSVINDIQDQMKMANISLAPGMRPLGNIPKSKSQPLLAAHQQEHRGGDQSGEISEEIDFGGENEEDRRELEQHRNDLKRMSVAVRFEPATVADFSDLDNLLNDLEGMVGKKGPKGTKVPPPLPDKPHPAKKDAMVKSASQGALSDQGETSQAEKIRLAMLKLSEANIKKVATRIYIETTKSFKTLMITSLMTSSQVAQDVVEKAMLARADDWTLFEIVNDTGVERPLRDFEIVTDVVASWGFETPNALLLKRYGYRDSLTSASTIQNYPRMCGWLFHEVRSGKWQKRFFELKANGLYHSKDAKGTQETLLYTIQNIDVYTLIRAKKRAPTKFCFAIRLQRRGTSSSNLDQPVAPDHTFFCVDQVEKMKDWVLSIRNAKVSFIQLYMYIIV